MHHFAWKCRDIDETVDFYENIIGLSLAKAISHDEPYPHKQIFFHIDDDSYISFIETGDSYGVKTDADEWIIHFAFKIDSTQNLLYAKQRLEANGIGVVGPIDDGFTQSIYFFDPNGLRLEIVCS